MLNPFGGLKKVFKPLNKAVKAVGGGAVKAVGKVGGGVTKAVGSTGRALHLPAPPGFKKKPKQAVSRLSPGSSGNTGVAGMAFGRRKKMEE